MSQDAKPDVMCLDGGAVVLGPRHRDLELARQKAELGMQARPLTDQLRGRARILDLVGGDAGEMIGRDIADAIAGGLDGVHLDIGEKVEDIGHVLELGPVELEILPRGEMAVAAIVAVADQRELPHLPRGERAVGNGDAQHIGVQLQVEAVLQAQRLELILRQRAVEAPFHLRPELAHALAHEARIEFVIPVHAACLAPRPRLAPACRDRP